MSPTRASYMMAPMSALPLSMPDAKPRQRDATTQTQRVKTAPTPTLQEVSEQDREWWMIEAQRMTDDLNKLREERARLFESVEGAQAESRHFVYELGRVKIGAERQSQQAQVAIDEVNRYRDEASGISVQIDLLRQENRESSEMVMQLEDKVREVEGKILKEAILQESSRRQAKSARSIRKAKRREARAQEAKRKAKEDEERNAKEEKERKAKDEVERRAKEREDAALGRMASTRSQRAKAEDASMRTMLSKAQGPPEKAAQKKVVGLGALATGMGVMSPAAGSATAKR